MILFGAMLMLGRGAVAFYHQAKLNVYDAEVAIEELLAAESEKLRVNLLDDEIFSAKIGIITQSGQRFNKAELDGIWIKFSQGGLALKITANWDHYGEYETPAQVETVISRLKEAIERGDKEFTFPTVEELNNPPIIAELDGTEEDDDDEPFTANVMPPEQKDDDDELADPPIKPPITDSLARAMKENLERVQTFCRNHDLSGALNEMKLYGICSEALRELRT